MAKTCVAGWVFSRTEAEMDFRVQKKKKFIFFQRGPWEHDEDRSVLASPTGCSRAHCPLEEAHVIPWCLSGGHPKKSLTPLTIALPNHEAVSSLNHLSPGQQGGAERHDSLSATLHHLCHTDLLLHDIWKWLLTGSGRHHFLRGHLGRGS